MPSQGWPRRRTQGIGHLSSPSALSSRAVRSASDLAVLPGWADSLSGFGFGVRRFLQRSERGYTSEAEKL
eukprot:2924815-Prymnesium_polylepis.1